MLFLCKTQKPSTLSTATAAFSNTCSSPPPNSTHLGGNHNVMNSGRTFSPKKTFSTQKNISHLRASSSLARGCRSAGRPLSFDFFKSFYSGKNIIPPEPAKIAMIDCLDWPLNSAVVLDEIGVVGKMGGKHHFLSNLPHRPALRIGLVTKIADHWVDHLVHPAHSLVVNKLDCISTISTLVQSWEENLDFQTNCGVPLYRLCSFF